MHTAESLVPVSADCAESLYGFTEPLPDRGTNVLAWQG